jgi:hypothetical protein
MKKHKSKSNKKPSNLLTLAKVKESQMKTLRVRAEIKRKSFTFTGSL